MPNAGSSEELREVVARLEHEVAALRASRRRVAEGADAERRAIERELHDGVQQQLVALAMDVRRVTGLLDRDANAAAVLLEDVTATVREALDEAARLASRIYPSMLGGRGLASALRSAATIAGVTPGVDVPAVAAYPPVITTALYRTWIEALSFAEPGSEAAIGVVDVDSGLSFEVAIVGRLPEGPLESIRDRIGALEGRVSVDDREGGASRIQGWLPLSSRP